MSQREVRFNGFISVKEKRELSQGQPDTAAILSSVLPLQIPASWYRNVGPISLSPALKEPGTTVASRGYLQLYKEVFLGG